MWISESLKKIESFFPLILISTSNNKWFNKQKATQSLFGQVESKTVNRHSFTWKTLWGTFHRDERKCFPMLWVPGLRIHQSGESARSRSMNRKYSTTSLLHLLSWDQWPLGTSCPRTSGPSYHSAWSFLTLHNCYLHLSFCYGFEIRGLFQLTFSWNSIFVPYSQTYLSLRYGASTVNVGPSTW